MWAKFDCNGADAYAAKAISPGTNWWAQADVYFPSSTLTACDDGDLFGFSADVLSLTKTSGGGFLAVVAMAIEDASYPSGVWEWGPSAGSSGGSVSPATSYTVKVHVNGTSISFYINGVLLTTGTASAAGAIDNIKIGGLFAGDCPCEWYFVTNVKVGTSDGGSDIFADDFSSGDFTNWTSTTGACSVVSSPSDCSSTAAISPDPTEGCHGDTVTITGSGFSASSPLTVTFAGIPVTFSEADSDGSGDVSGTFSIPLGGMAACGGCNYPVTVTDGDGNSATSMFTLCCTTGADKIDRITQLGPTPTPETAGLTILDYTHHQDAHWILVFNTLDPTIGSTFPPDASYKPLTVYKIPDDGSSISSVDVDLGFCFEFAKPANAKTFHCQKTDPLCGVVGVYADTVWWFESWSKPVLDARFASDGTTLWIGVLTTETVPYPYTTLGDVDLSVLTDGYTTFKTTREEAKATFDDSECPPAGGSATNPIIRVPVGTIGICHRTAYPLDDGGDAFSSNWSPPRVVMFSGDIGGFTRIDTMDAKYCPGQTNGGGSVCDGTVDQTRRAAGKFFSGISLAASPAQEGVCHLVWSEGGTWGSYGGAGSDEGGCPQPCVWDGGPPNQDYRIGYSIWSASAKTSETDLFHTHIDRQPGDCYPFSPGYNFTCDGTVYGYLWPDTADLAASNVFQVRNDTGSPILFLAAAQTSETAADVECGLDNVPSFPDGAAVDAYDLSSGAAVLDQTLDTSLLPTATEIHSANPSGDAPDSVNASFAVGFNPLAGLAVSNLYTDPLDSDTDVYLLGIPWTNAATGGFSAGFYRIPGDVSATFDILDGIRAVGYSILVNPGVYFDPSMLAHRFISDPGNLWSNAFAGPWQLDRLCASGWRTYAGLVTSQGLDQVSEDFYWDGSDALFAVGAFAGPPFAWALADLNICRGCVPCTCGSTGLHFWHRIP